MLLSYHSSRVEWLGGGGGESNCCELVTYSLKLSPAVTDLPQVVVVGGYIIALNVA